MTKLPKSMMIATDKIETCLSISLYGVDALVSGESWNWCVQEVKVMFWYPSS